MEHLGVSRPVVGITVPTGYSFNLDGTAIYLTMASLFIAEALGTPLSFSEQISLLLFMMIASKGAAGVTGAGLAILTGGLTVAPARSGRRGRSDRRHRPVHVRGPRGDQLLRQRGRHRADWQVGRRVRQGEGRAGAQRGRPVRRVRHARRRRRGAPTSRWRRVIDSADGASGPPTSVDNPASSTERVGGDGNADVPVPPVHGITLFVDKTNSIVTEPIGWQTLQRLTALRADQARNSGPVGVCVHDRNRSGGGDVAARATGAGPGRGSASESNSVKAESQFDVDRPFHARRRPRAADCPYDTTQVERPRERR